MPTSYSLRIGRGNVIFRRSDNQIAVRPNTGMGQSMEAEIRTLGRRTPVARGRRLGGFEILDVQASADDVSRAREVLQNAASVSQNVGVYHTSADNVPFIPIGTIYLSFKSGTPTGAKQNVLDRHRLELVASERDDFLTVRVSGHGADALEVAKALQQENSVAVAEPDLVTPKRTRAFVLPNDELVARQWHLENSGTIDGQTLGYKQGADARVVAAWKHLNGLGSSEVVLGVIDDGFDLNHPDLVGKIISPWDFERNSSDVSPVPDLAKQDGGNWHGTACAGVAVGSALGGQIVGVAPNAKLLPVRMNDNLSDDLVAKWFDYMTHNGAWVVSCSWSAEAKVYALPERIAHAISRCTREGRGGKGCVVVFAAGNSSVNVNDPPNSQNGFATHPDVIVVSASTSRDAYADYSSFGKEVSVCAPSGGFGGWNVITSDVLGTYIDAAGVERNSGYAPGDYNFNFTGTSSACPVVAGVCALVLSANPGLNSKDVHDIVTSTARKIGPDGEYGVDGHSEKFGFGCVDALNAVKEAIQRGGQSDAVVAAVRRNDRIV
jgi:subtilisin family serine protease